MERGAMATLSLHYFPVRGRGEAPRMMLAYTGKPWKDVIWELNGEQWKQAKGERFPYGKLPVLEVGDSAQIPQYGAIVRYLGHELGLMPESSLERARQDAIFELTQEVVHPCHRSINGLASDEERNTYLTSQWPARAPLFEAELGGKQFFGGDSPSFVDFAVHHIVETTRLLKADALDGTPNLGKWEGRVASLPGVEEYIAKRPAPRGWSSE